MSLTALQVPRDAGSLATFLGMIGWQAGNVPRLAEIRQPLVDALAAAGKRALRPLANVPLTGICGAPSTTPPSSAARTPYGMPWHST